MTDEELAQMAADYACYEGDAPALAKALLEERARCLALEQKLAAASSTGTKERIAEAIKRMELKEAAEKKRLAEARAAAEARLMAEVERNYNREVLEGFETEFKALCDKHGVRVTGGEGAWATRGHGDAYADICIDYDGERP